MVMTSHAEALLISVGRVRLAVSLGLAAVSISCAAANASHGREYRPAADVPRLEALPLDGDDIGLVRDFDIAGDTIYLLDATGRIVVIEQGASGLRLVGHISRPGSGPGELSRPTGLAVTDTGIVVVDGTRLHYFDRRGAAQSVKWLDLPCPIALPAVAPARDGVFIHGNCLRRGVATDTMKAVLLWSAEGDSWTTVGEDVRYTSDGRTGTAFGASSLLTTGVAGAHLFGGGEANCISRIDDPAGPPTLTETLCPAATVLYRADPPAGMEQRLRAARSVGMNLSWPETLPAYADRFVAAGGAVLVRAFTTDSLVLQLAAPHSRDLAVAPFERLIGCKAGGCLWLLEDEVVPRLIVLSRAAIEDLVGSSHD
jgi:hypothetical protein